MAKKSKTAKKSKARKSKKATKAKAAKTRSPKAKKSKRAKKAPAKKMTTAAKQFVPPYKCQKTLVSGVCLKYFYNANSGEYDLGGDRVACSSCEYFM